MNLSNPSNLAIDYKKKEKWVRVEEEEELGEPWEKLISSTIKVG